MHNSNEALLKEKKLFVLDMDGTFYLGGRILPGSLKFMETLERKNTDFLFFTNNSSRSSEYYIKKLASMDCHITQRNIATSGDVTIAHLLKYHPGRKVYLVGTETLEQSFLAAGIPLVQDDADIVVAGFDTTLTYEKLTKACNFIRNGCTFIATHLDLNCPTEDGFIPDCGAICALITASTGVTPKYLGKPFAETLEYVVQKTGYDKKDIVFVGDRLYTDIATGFNHGVTSILVLSGETSVKDLQVSQIKPDYVFPSLKEIADVL